MYKVDLEFFQGPLDLLLHLIEKMEIDIHNISIAKLADSYIEYLNSQKNISLENAEEYIVMASKLIHLKSKRLLPSYEDGENVETEEELVNRLIDYKIFKAVQKDLYELQKNRLNFGDKKVSEISLDAKLADIKIEKLYHTFQNIIHKKDVVINNESNIRYRKDISIEEIKKDMDKLFAIKKRLDIYELFNEYHSKEELVAVFICLLNMLKEGLLISKIINNNIIIEILE